MTKQRTYFTLTPEALAIIDQRAPSPHKRGEWISAALVEHEAILQAMEREPWARRLVAELRASPTPVGDAKQ